ncbi:hypothetical protein RFI_08161 [Reticulomyxa filosa]|uniref:DNA repair metallo-beta-lactamase domain-containing protein n=1 Tax=Reticulomyxa filosa TaxID=46433 RepID=X6NSK0_RETFI|nr:hypothetical protein RFI_08161 [Reticulomyxa filosa]|eukprot:ETO28966.1 hypothetical protein RFI_08161 [Reticulomyxa filosa]
MDNVPRTFPKLHIKSDPQMPCAQLIEPTPSQENTPVSQSSSECIKTEKTPPTLAVQIESRKRTLTSFRSETWSDLSSPTKKIKLVRAATTIVQVDDDFEIVLPNNDDNAMTEHFFLPHKKENYEEREKGGEEEERRSLYGNEEKSQNKKRMTFHKEPNGCTRLAPKNAVYFLSHFHSDHYAGLTKSFCQGPIYGSQITCRLAQHMLNVGCQYLVPLPMFTKTEVANSSPKTWVTLLEANHCPGAAMFLFEVESISKGKEYYLHCGDFRCEYEPNSWFQQCNVMHLQPFVSKQVLLQRMYLDTTYCLNQMILPRQSDTIQFVADCCKYLFGTFGNDVCVLLGTYSIGKERILQAICEECNYDGAIFVTPNKQKIFDVLYNSNVSVSSSPSSSRRQMKFTNNALESNIHVVNMWNISFQYMDVYFLPEDNNPNNVDYSQFKTKSESNTNQHCKRYEFMVGFKPTGWTGSQIKIRKSRDRKRMIIEIPYSEHSSFHELCKFVHDMSPKEILPTVSNTSDESVLAQLNLLEFHSKKDKLKLDYSQEVFGKFKDAADIFVKHGFTKGDTQECREKSQLSITSFF